MKLFNSQSQLIRGLKTCAKALIYSLKFSYAGFTQKKGKKHLKYIFQLANDHLNAYVGHLRVMLQQNYGIDGHKYMAKFDKDKWHKLHQHATGLHTLLPSEDRYSYTLLMVVDSPNPKHFKKTLYSALQQTAPKMELLVAFKGEQNREIQETFETLKKEFGDKLKSIDATGTTPQTLNKLAEKATGNYLIIIDDDGWLRPDLLFRYEQCLRLLPSPEQTILYCDEYALDSFEFLLPKNQHSMMEKIHFPYLFSTFIPPCLLIPKPLWDQVKGLNEDFSDAHNYDLLLKLDLAKAEFHKIPIQLFARRSTQKELQPNHSQFIQSLSEYALQKDLKWKVIEGYTSDSLRAIPSLEKTPYIHVIIPYKNQKQMTIAAIKSLEKQQGVSLKITAVDNRSDDLTISEELEKIGVEVIRIDEPFNFSRLNNLAVQRSQIGQACDLLFFMNNDVELEPDALLEMCRWIDQPQIGLVGCRLNYPNGHLQCGGVDFNRNGPMCEITWQLTDNNLPFDKLQLQRILRVAPAVTGAATLVKRSVFQEVAGFDEVWFPINFSDTSLALKIQAHGMLCFYTPFAVGIHHESVSRNPHVWDFEASSWLHEKYFTHKPWTFKNKCVENFDAKAAKAQRS